MNKLVWSVLIILTLLVCVIPCHSTALRSEQIDMYFKKMAFHQQDILVILKGANSHDTEIGNNISDIIDKCEIHLMYMQSLLTVHSFVKNLSDRKKVKPLIDKLIKHFATNTGQYIKQVNIGITYTKNQAILITANKLRDDLRELKELLDNCD